MVTSPSCETPPPSPAVSAPAGKLDCSLHKKWLTRYLRPKQIKVTTVVQVLALHPGVRYIHLGCDEVYQLGGCGECGGCEVEGSVGLSITLERNASQADYLLATLLTTGAFLLIFIVVSLISRSLKYEYRLFEELPRLLR